MQVFTNIALIEITARLAYADLTKFFDGPGALPNSFLRHRIIQKPDMLRTQAHQIVGVQ